MIEIAYVTKNMASNGITNVVMNYGTRLDKDKFRLTIITGGLVELDEYRKECKAVGIKIVELPPKRKLPLAYYCGLWKELKKGYDIVHVHGNSATITAEMLIAKFAGIKVRIAHCHNIRCDHTKLHRMLQPIFKKLYTYGFACSTEAGKWLFGDGQFEVLPNAFQAEKFIFNQTTREKVRKSLGLEDTFVIGNVARFNDVKNHGYLLDIFEKVAEKREDAKLLLIGNGPNLDLIKAKIEKHPYKGRIVYYGVTDKVEELYTAMDVFVLPTKYEGLGIVFVEAQINGLPVITSDRVPKEVALGNGIIFLPLENSLDLWCDTILKANTSDRNSFYRTHNVEIMRYNIGCNVKKLEKIYQELVDENC